MENHNGLAQSVNPDSDSEEEKENRLRVSENSQMAVLDVGALAAASSHSGPAVNTLNAHKSRIHMGPKITVVHNVDNNDKVKDLPLLTYLATVIRNTSVAERVACALALIVLVVCISLIVYFTTRPAAASTDTFSEEWNITREMWLAQFYNKSDAVAEFAPLRLVIINHSTSPECFELRVCSAEMRNLQSWFIATYKYDIPYNFLVGNDNRIYEGRGWGIIGAHAKGFNKCSVGVGFIGNYDANSNTKTRPSETQIQRLNLMLQDGVEKGYLHPDYVIVGAKDIDTSNVSPGSYLYEAMQSWKHYNNRIYKGMSCEEINASNKTNVT